MSRRLPLADRPRTFALALLLVAGCASPKPREHSSKEVMESATSDKLTRPQAADIQIAMARSLEDSGDRETAEKAYREALKKDPKRADAEDRLAILCDRKGDTKGANAHFARAAALDPKNPEILCDQGYSFYLQRRWSESERRFKEAIRLDPRHARSHTNLGLAMARQGEEKAALDQFTLAGCDAADAQSNLGLVLAMEGRFDEARKAYEVSLASKPDSPIAKEGLRAATLALEEGRNPGRALLAGGRVDPAVRKASTSEAPR